MATDRVWFVSEWGPYGAGASQAKHELFGAFVCDTIDRGAPWLARLIQLSGAQVQTCTGGFFISCDDGARWDGLGSPST